MCCSCRVCVCVGGVVLCRCVCVCDLLIFLHRYPKLELLAVMVAAPVGVN